MPSNTEHAEQGVEVMSEEVEIAVDEPIATASTPVPASGSAGPSESEVGPDAPDRRLTELMTKEAFQKRAMAMFLGGGGAPKASRIDAAFETPTDGLIILAVEAVAWLYDARGPYGRATVQASAGEVDQKEASAYLINDVLDQRRAGPAHHRARGAAGRLASQGGGGGLGSLPQGQEGDDGEAEGGCQAGGQGWRRSKAEGEAGGADGGDARALQAIRAAHRTAARRAQAQGRASACVCRVSRAY
jgi:hypothetical protein